jgi:hypothetical protein
MKKLRLYLRKYITMLLIDLGILLRPKSKGVMVIDESEWHYPFFNCDFIRTILSQTLSVLLQGYTPYIELKNRKNGETNWDTFFMQPFGASVRNGFSKNGGGICQRECPTDIIFTHLM